jgi:hypothetical protein
MGSTLSAGHEIKWRWDYSHPNGPSALRYFRQVPYLEPDQVGDYRLIWELNRHQYLVAVMQAFLFTGEPKYTAEVWAQIEAWWEQNPFTEGINWTSALEVAFRSLSWIWLYHLGRQFMPENFRTRFLIELYRHARFLEYNLSFYFSPNTHLQGEAVALHAIGTVFPDFPGASRWRKLGGRTAARQMELQVREDGGHFENSTYYHFYALDFFVFHSVLANIPAKYTTKLELMASYASAIGGPDGIAPLIGDDDGGRVFHPFGERSTFGRASLATCGVLFNRPEWITSRDEISKQAAWWLGERALDCVPGARRQPASRSFPQTGTAVLEAGDIHIVMDNGPFGWGSGGHSHCDTLSFTVRSKSDELLIDPGTYTYVLSPWRDRFRGSGAHNTVRVGGRDQAIPRKAFSWYEKPVCNVLEQRFEPNLDYVVAECRYGDAIHRRRLVFSKAVERILLLDEIEWAQPDVCTAEQFWHPGVDTFRESSHCFRLGASSRLILAGGTDPEISAGGEFGWRSRCLSSKEMAQVVTSELRGRAPLYLAAVLDLRSDASCLPPTMSLTETRGSRVISYTSGNAVWRVRFETGQSRSFEVLPVQTA